MPPPPIVKIFTQIIQEILPTSEEKVHLHRVIQKITSIINQSSIPPQIQIQFIEPQGSTGLKQTALKDSSDVDLFIGLNPDLLNKQLIFSKKQAHAYLQKFFKDLCVNWLIPVLQKNGVNALALSYAEHPYISASFENVELDIVLCFDISAENLYQNGPITAVDRSPHHSRFIRDTLTEPQKHDVMLLKHFLKCHFVYGDKSPVGQSGFIGYAAELLIAYYGDIYTLFTHFDELPEKYIIIPINHIPQKKSKGKNDSSIEHDFLKILDPTDPNRNVGASISNRSYYYAQEMIHRFLLNPTIEFFTKQSLPKISDALVTSKERANFYFVIFKQVEVDHYTKFRDKAYSLMNKFLRYAMWESTGQPRFERIVDELVYNTETGEYVLAFYTSTPNISPIYFRKGPTKMDKNHYSEFRSHHPDSYEKDGFLWVLQKRQYIFFGDLVNDYFQMNGISKLAFEKSGTALDSKIPILADGAMGILRQAILPFVKFQSGIYINPSSFSE